jgi:hypothetical protein
VDPTLVQPPHLDKPIGVDLHVVFLPPGVISWQIPDGALYDLDLCSHPESVTHGVEHPVRGNPPDLHWFYLS